MRILRSAVSIWKNSCRLTDTVLNIGSTPVMALAVMDTDTARLEWNIHHSKEEGSEMTRTTSENPSMRGKDNLSVSTDIRAILPDAMVNSQGSYQMTLCMNQ